MLSPQIGNPLWLTIDEPGCVEDSEGIGRSGNPRNSAEEEVLE